MKRIAFIFLSLIIVISCGLFANGGSAFDEVFKKMAVKLSGVEKKLPNKTVAIYGFEVIGRPGDSYAVYATEKLTHEIVSAETLLVIERSRIDEVLAEQSLNLTGAIDAGTAAKIGKILAVDAVIIGTIHVFEDQTEFIARAISSEKGLILASADEKVSVESAEKPIVPNAKKPDEAPAVIDTMSPSIVLNRAAFTSDDEIIATYSGFPGNKNDWITVVDASLPDTDYGSWFYTDGKKSGTHSFGNLDPGKYEVRAYFDWPAGGYEVRLRIAINVDEP